MPFSQTIRSWERRDANRRQASASTSSTMLSFRRCFDIDESGKPGIRFSTIFGGGMWEWVYRYLMGGLHSSCQSCKCSSIVNYGSRVEMWGIFKLGMTLESQFTIVEPL